MQQNKQKKAKKVKKSVFCGTGSIYQFFGVLCFPISLVFPPMIILAVILFVVGCNKSVKYQCDNCNGEVSKNIKICPWCKSFFE